MCENDLLAALAGNWFDGSAAHAKAWVSEAVVLQAAWRRFIARRQAEQLSQAAADLAVPLEAVHLPLLTNYSSAKDAHAHSGWILSVCRISIK